MIFPFFCGSFYVFDKEHTYIYREKNKNSWTPKQSWLLPIHRYKGFEQDEKKIYITAAYSYSLENQKGQLSIPLLPFMKMET